MEFVFIHCDDDLCGGGVSVIICFQEVRVSLYFGCRFETRVDVHDVHVSLYPGSSDFCCVETYACLMC